MTLPGALFIMNDKNILVLSGGSLKGIAHIGVLKVLEKNNMITRMGEKYSITYFISVFLEANMQTFEEIVRKLDKSK